MPTPIEKIRNIAIIAHVDHGKTTIVDVLLKQGGIFRDNEQPGSQIMDSNDLEKERGITILAKNTAIEFEGHKINIVDTPGHADFGGEVERVLKMVDGVLLVIDAHDGPMPQTRFVLRKALAMALKPIVVVNKVDRPDARPVAVVDLVLDLFIELGANDEQIDFPVIFASARLGLASSSLDELEAAILEKKQNPSGFGPLLEAIRDHVPCPLGKRDEPFGLLISSVDYDSYVGRIGIGKINSGRVQPGQDMVVCRHGEGGQRHAKIAGLFRFTGLKKTGVEEAAAGEIVAVTGLDDLNIGDTVCDPQHVQPLPFVAIDEPTIAMTFSVNDSPFAGQEGRYVTSRHLRERLRRETLTNVAMQLEETASTESFIVKGRGELHLSILIETMRREGYEFAVGKPRVILKEEAGARLEPVEQLLVDVPEEYIGVVIEKLGGRKAELVNMDPPQKGYSRLEFKIPSRGLIGYRSEFLTDTRGHGTMNSTIAGYEPWKGEIQARNHGVLVAWETGEAVTYGLHNAQERGSLFIGPGTAVYAGMIIGVCPKNDDIIINVCKRKHVTNIRAAGSDEALRLVTPLAYSLEQYLEFIADDELIEITPKSIRLRKKILDANQRSRQRA